MQRNKLTVLLEKAFNTLYDKDKYLISRKSNDTSNNNDEHGSERNIVSQYANYLQNLINKIKNYNFDVEYNRNFDKVKKIENKKIIPDLIVHERGNNDNNLLAVEFKPWWNKEKDAIEKDLKKLFGLLNKPYNYKYALFVMLEKVEPILYWLEKDKLKIKTPRNSANSAVKYNNGAANE